MKKANKLNKGLDSVEEVEDGRVLLNTKGSFVSSLRTPTILLPAVRAASASGLFEAHVGQHGNYGSLPIKSQNLSSLAQFWQSHNGFDQGLKAQALSKQVEHCYANLFCSGDVIVAAGELGSASQQDEVIGWSLELLKLGFRLGLAAAMAIWFLCDCIFQAFAVGSELPPPIDKLPAFTCFCALAGLVCVHWSWGIQVWIWTRFRINYIYVFDLDPRFIRSYIRIFDDCALDTALYFGLTILYYKSYLGQLPLALEPGVVVWVAVIYAIVRLIFPFTERRSLWLTILSIAMPWRSGTVSFFQIYVGDVLTSMVSFRLIGYICIL